MAQRNSGYDRKAGDYYPTPEWVTEVILPHIPDQYVWEPACGQGHMVDVLEKTKHVLFSDINDPEYPLDFLTTPRMPEQTTAIITNPPFSQAQKFIEHSLELTSVVCGRVAMLLPSDYDTAKKRVHLFKDCPQFSKKIVLNRRIVWFERTDGKKAAPSSNHAWYVWDWRNRKPPILEYEPY